MKINMKQIRKKIKKGLYGNARVFDDIYKTHAWGVDETKIDKFSSGSGSNLENAGSYKDIIINITNSRRVKVVLDIGCGDFRVSNEIIKSIGQEILWIAIDVSKVIIDRNKSCYSYQNVKFLHMDATLHPLPPADLVLIREVMQHLSNSDIIKMMNNIPVGAHVVSTNTVPVNCKKKNGDIATGAQSRAYLGQGIFLDLPPFNLRLDDLGEWQHTNKTTKFICQELFLDKFTE